MSEPTKTINFYAMQKKLQDEIKAATETAEGAWKRREWNKYDHAVATRQTLEAVLLYIQDDYLEANRS